jgi:hypothetical protein
VHNNIAISLPERKVSAVHTGIWMKREAAASPELAFLQDIAAQESEKDVKLDRIMNKAKMGKKLTSDELRYVAKKAPEIYVKICRAMAEREALRKSMEAAKTKEQVTAILVTHIAVIKQSGEDEFAMAMRSNMLAEEHREYTATMDYARKADMESQAKEQKRCLEQKFDTEEALRADAQERVDNEEAKQELTESAEETQTNDQETEGAINDSLERNSITEPDAGKMLEQSEETAKQTVLRGKHTTRPKQANIGKKLTQRNTFITVTENYQHKIGEYEEQTKGHKRYHPKIDEGA